MQTLTTEGRNAVFRTVNRVARNGMTEISHMNSNLVSSACFKLELYKRKILIFFKHGVVRYGIFGILLYYTHFFAVIGASADGGIDRTFFFFKMPMDNRPVFSDKRMNAYLA